MPDSDPPRDTTQPPDQSDAAENSMVVFEFDIPAEEFVLTDTLQAFPDVTLEFEKLIPTNDRPLPYLWTTDGATSRVRDAMAEDPAVERVETVATFNEGALYHFEWDLDDGGLLRRLGTSQRRTSVLQMEGQGDEWHLKLRFPSREALADFREFYDERDIDLRVVRLYDLTDPKLGQYNITEKQREALIRALDMGHFEIPREATLAEVAEEIGISPKSLSERLRRGQTNLVSNTLTIGHPTGIGLGEQ